MSETLAYNRKGLGIPIVFLHAFPLSGGMWKGELEFFSKNFQPLCPDLPGFGDSPVTSPETSMQSAADAVKKLLDEICPDEKIILCGLSMGGYIAFEFMRKYGSAVRALVLASTRATPDTLEARESRLRMVELVKSRGTPAVAETVISKLLGKSTLDNNPDTVQKVHRLILNTRPEGVAAALLGMAARRDSTDLLNKIQCPTLVMAGEEDAVIKPEDMRSMKDKIHFSRFESVPKAGHLINLEQPEVFDKLVINFLKAKVL